MRVRVFSFLALWTLVLTLVFFKFVTGTIILISCLGLFAQWEFYKMQERKGYKLFKKAGIFCGVLLFSISYFHLKKNIGDASMWASLELFIILSIIIGAMTRQVFEQDQSQSVATIAITLFGFFYVPYLFNFVLKILFWRGTDLGFFLIVYFVAVTKLTDAGAYFFGSLIGKHKMSPRISPKKTWEGFLGGIIVAVISSILLIKAFSLELIIPGHFPWILGAVLGIISVVGDLGESVIKRDSHSKDSGCLIPGIGGSLDLIDSILFTAPIFYTYLTVFPKA